MSGSRPRPLVLCVLDGWGHRRETDHNAIALAQTPHYDGFLSHCPHSLLAASAADVGLPAGQMGNSEVGHMNLGAGRVVVQDLPRVDAAIADGSLFAAPAFARLAEHLGRGGTCHLMGLLSPGGVHAHQAHLAALARALTERGVRVALHAFLDGRDTPPRSARDHLARYLADTADLEDHAVATLCGRYYAMDRDKRWPRVAEAYGAIIDAAGAHAADPLAAIEAAYAVDLGDEFVVPTAIGDYTGMRDGDGLLMANFRSDRAREILAALVEPDFDGFVRPRTVSLIAAGMVEYSAALNAHMPALLPALDVEATLGELIARAGLSQLRIAETEKYAHVTFFFSGGREAPFPAEERILVPSPKVATYDLKPEMSAVEVTDRLVAAIDEGRFDFILVNYANTDMVGHTGILPAAVRAVEAVDPCLGRLADAVRRAGGALIVTADHGNAERMHDPGAGQPHTQHTTELVPLILAVPPRQGLALRDGRLADVAPTALALLGLAQPAAMAGRSLLVAARQRNGIGATSSANV